MLKNYTIIKKPPFFLLVLMMCVSACHTPEDLEEIKGQMETFQDIDKGNSLEYDAALNNELETPLLQLNSGATSSSPEGASPKGGVFIQNLRTPVMPSNKKKLQRLGG